MEIHSVIKDIQSGTLDPVEHTEKVFEQLEALKEYHYMNVVSKELALETAKRLKTNPQGKLAGLPISIKDSICVKGVESAAGSKMLQGYKPLYHATAVQRAVEQGALVLGKTAQDEFGFGGFSANVGLGFEKPLNPFDKERACGGSSGGAAGLAQKLPHVAFGESTGGSIVNPASFCSVFGLCPTYGRVSRYGLIDYGNSLDKVGPLSTDLYAAALVLETIAGQDKQDSTSLSDPVDSYTSYLDKDVSGLKLAVMKEGFAEGVDASVADEVWKVIKKLESLGAKYEEVSLPITMKYGIPTYYMISTSEASSNLAKLCGMRYGFHKDLQGDFNEYFTSVRSDGFGEEAKRRIMLGTFARMSGYRDAFYMKAMKVRTKIINEYKAILKNHDAIVSPTVPILPPKFEEISSMTVLQQYMIDQLPVGPNLAGLPHMNVPSAFAKDLPVGSMFISDHLKEGVLFQLAKEFR